MKRKKMRERGKINILKDKKNEFSGSYTTPLVSVTCPKKTLLEKNAVLCYTDRRGQH